MTVSPKISTQSLTALLKRVEDKLGPLEPETLSTTTAIVMSEIRSLTELNNTERKDLVLHIIQTLADKLDESKKESVKQLVSTVVPRTIDTLIDITKGKIRINKMTKTQSLVAGFWNRLKYLMSCGCCTCRFPYTCEKVE
tara:strand:- start:1046 stop:1465 length:420 start_codon:yes stop_codon:yes gene_type:complete